MEDPMVLATQRWLNSTYKDKTGFGSVPEDGHTGWDTIYGLIRALQIELGITATANNFGPGTQSRFTARWPHGISQTDKSDNVYGIIQGALWCKGYAADYGDNITTKFTNTMASAIRVLKTDIGIASRDATIDLELMMVLLSMKQFQLLSTYGATAPVRAAQRAINGKYRSYTGIIPTDGLYGREMNTALIQVLQSLEGYSPDEATGNFGAGTRSRLRTVSSGSSAWVWLASVALLCNQKLSQTFDTWNSTVASAVRSFQTDYALPVTGVVDTTTWMSLLTSKGNPDRAAKACDCATILNAQQAKDLKNAGYTHVGRYLTGTVGSNNQSKALTLDEIGHITAAGLSVFPIYQDGGYYSDYFSYAGQGTIDAKVAINAAKKLGFPKGTTIYFAVDFDAYGFQIDDLIIPYFLRIKETFNSWVNDKAYKVGIYGPRLVCSKVAEAGYTAYSFVSDMSTGFAGNLGYPIPKNWAFDQFHEFTFASSPSFPLDKDAYSGKDQGTKTFDKVDYKTADALKKDNADSMIKAAKQAFVRAVLEPLGFYVELLTVGVQFDRKIILNTTTTDNLTIVTSMVASSSAGTTSSNPNAIDIKVNNDGTLTTATRNAIGSASAKFDVKNLGSNVDFAKRVMSIATSIKGGSISTSVSFTGTRITASIRVDSPNLAPSGSQLTEKATVTINYEITLHPHAPFEFRIPKETVEVVAVAGIAALFIAAALASGGASIPEEGVLITALAEVGAA